MSLTLVDPTQLKGGGASFNASAFAFSIIPGGSLVIGSNTVTVAPVPPGVNGTDANHYLYIDQGTGTAEAVLITGGTAVAGAGSGTLIFTCANTHTGAWRLRSATAGAQEAIQVSAGGGVVSMSAVSGVPIPIYAPITVTSGITLRGYSTPLNFRSVVAGQTCINLVGSAATATSTSTVIPFATRHNAAFRFDLTLASVAGFSVGSLVYIVSNMVVATFPITYTQIATVKLIVGNVVTFVDPIMIPIETGAGASNTIQVITPVQNARVEGFVIDGTSGVTGFGVSSQYTYKCSFRDLEVKNFIPYGGSSAGVILTIGLDCVFENLSAYNCGSGGYNDISIYYQTRSVIIVPVSENASGFGPGIYNSLQANVTGVVVTSPLSRGFKIKGCAWSVFQGIQITNAGVGDNGLAIDGGTYKCKFSNLVLIGNGGANLWSDGVSNNYNDYDNVQTASPADSATPVIDLLLYDDFTTVKNYNGAGGVYVGDGAGNQNITVGVANPFACKVTHSTTQLIHTGALTTLTFDTDSGGNLMNRMGAHSTGSHPDRITVPVGQGANCGNGSGTSAALVQISGQITFAASASGTYRLAQIFKTGTTTCVAVSNYGVPSATLAPVLVIPPVIVPVADGDYFTIEVIQDSGGDLNVVAGEVNTWFQVVRL